MTLSPRSGRQRHMIPLPPASRACSFCPIGSWGSAALHPRLYADTRSAGWRIRPCDFCDSSFAPSPNLSQRERRRAQAWHQSRRIYQRRRIDRRRRL